MIDIYCKDNICPICRSMMDSIPDDPEKFCKNGCYVFIEIFDIRNDFSIYIFNEFSAMGSYHENSESFIKDIEDEINYWKENERYVMKIIMGDAYDDQ